MNHNEYEKLLLSQLIPHLAATKDEKDELSFHYQGLRFRIQKSHVIPTRYLSKSYQNNPSYHHFNVIAIPPVNCLSLLKRNKRVFTCQLMGNAFSKPSITLADRAVKTVCRLMKKKIELLTEAA